ncbi:MAG: AEC family transporter [Bacteroidota bacterium]
MEKLILLFICFGLGILLKTLPNFPKNTHLGINTFVIYVSLPAISLRYIPEIQISWTMLYPFFSGFLIFFLAYLFFRILASLIPLSKAEEGCLILTCGLGNTSFLGFPVIEGLYQEQGLQIALLVDQGTFLALASGGIFLAMYYSGSEVKMNNIGKRILYFPPFLAFVAALCLIPFEIPEIFTKVLNQLGGTLTPLALFSVGLQLEWKVKAFPGRHFALGLLYKLGLAPLVVLLGLKIGGFSGGYISQVTVLEAAMPPMITASILASQYKLAPSLANYLAGMGIFVSFLSLTLWYFFLSS